MVEVLLNVHRNRRLIRDGEPRTATSTFTQLMGEGVGGGGGHEVEGQEEGGR